MSLSTALATGDVTKLPSRRDEDWRWTDLRGLVRALPAPSQRSTSVEVTSGIFDHLATEHHVLETGVDTAAIVVPDTAQAAVTLRIISRGEASFRNVATISVGPNARLRLMETYEGDTGGYVTDTQLTILLEPGAVMERIVLAQDGAEGISVSTAQVSLAPGAEYSQTLITCGARRQRLETRVTHPGAGGVLRLDSAYLLADKRHADLTTEVVHRGLDGTTSQLTKGVVRGQSRGVFQGRIVVETGADRTDARMRHQALILSDKAEVDAKPELLIHADDVQCAHGNTIGALDEEALFYMRQRGLSEEEARALLTTAFVGEVIDRIEFEPAREIVRAWAAERLAG